ncbi:MAG: Hsp20/alpha crystallin family protein [Bacilli bacterium]|nr:Hsp20/alpha crystallin family protein [Bacilli bacterium]
MLPRKFYIDDVFDELLEANNHDMKCDISEKENTFIVEMDLPGYKKEDIKIECNNGNLIINCEKKDVHKEEGQKYIRRERRYGKCSRSFYLGDIDQDGIKASFLDGTLTILVPKIDEEKNKKYIDII